jgi:N-acetylmuramoyl-L-alanine amidase
VSKLRVIIDPGHGGINPQTGQYVTSGKRSRHPVDGEVYFEGQVMRVYAKEFRKVLETAGYEVVFTVDPDDWRDVSLRERSDIAKRLHKEKPSVLVSLHTNADSDSAPNRGVANGHEVYTSPGVDDSDFLAKYWIEFFELIYKGEVRIRKDERDGFPDKEARFHMLTQTRPMPAILIEFLFHTNDSDVRRLRDWHFRLQCAIAFRRALDKFQEYLKSK